MDQILGSGTSGKRGFLPLIEGPSKMTDPELLRKTIVFLFQGTAARPGTRSPAGLLIIVSWKSRLKTGRKWRLVPGFSRIIPGSGPKTGLWEMAPGTATVGEWEWGGEGLSLCFQMAMAGQTGERVQTMNNLFTYCKHHVYNLYIRGLDTLHPPPGSMEKYATCIPGDL